MDERFFRDADGVDVFYRRWLPRGQPRLRVIVAHGMSEHSGRYGRIAAALRERGHAVYALDHRGHGRTARSTGIGRTGPSGMQGLLADLTQLAEQAHLDVGPRPLVLFGHSMGSLLAQAWAEREGAQLAGLALSGSPGLGEGLREAAAGLRAAADSGLADRPLSALAALNQAFEPARTAFDWLTRDAAEVDAYLADPLCGDSVPMTHGFITELMALAADAMEPAAIGKLPPGLPVLLLTGERDPASSFALHVRSLEQRLRDAGLAVEAIYYPGARHEVLNELDRDQVQRDFLAWLERIAAARR